MYQSNQFVKYNKQNRTTTAVEDVRRTRGRVWSGRADWGGAVGVVWIPAGFAHGFRVISERAQVLYKATDYYAPEHERTLAWNDPALKINWELESEPIVSAKDQRGVVLRDAETFE